MRPKSAEGVDAPPIWSSFGQRRRVTVLDIAHVLPAPGVAGVQLSNWNTHQAAQCRLPASGVPASLPDEVQAALGPPTQLNPFSDECRPEEDLGLMRQALASVERTGRLCRYMFSKGHWTSWLRVPRAHAAGHRLLRYVKAARADEDTEMSTAFRTVYQALDAELGSRIRSHCSDSNVFVVSAFGVEEMYPVQGLVDDFLLKLGYRTRLAPASPSRWRSPSPPHSAATRWRTALSNRVPTAMQERLLSDNLHDYRLGPDESLSCRPTTTGSSA